MTETNVFQLIQPEAFADPLTEVLRNGRQRLLRHGHLPEREIMTGIGPVAVRCLCVRDRVGEGSEPIRFSSAILLPYARRSKSLEVLIPLLYLKGVSTGDFEEELVVLLGKDAGGLSGTTVGGLQEVWSEDHGPWSTRYHFCVPRQQTHRLPAGHQPPYACTDDSRGWNRW